MRLPGTGADGRSAETPFVVRYVRATSDVGRLAGSLVLLGLGVALAWVAEETLAGVEADLTEAFAELPAVLALLVVAVAQVLFLLLLVSVPLVLLLTKHVRTLGVAVLGILMAVATMRALESVLPDRAPPGTASGTGTFIFDDGWPPATALAGFTAAALVIEPLLPRRWRRSAWLALGTLVLLRMITATVVPLDIVVSLAAGGLVGGLLLLAFGRPLRLITADGVGAAMRAADIDVHVVHEVGHGHDTWRFVAQPTDDEHYPHALLVKVTGIEDWHSDRWQRTYRRIRLRDVGDDTPYSSPRRAVAVESMLLHQAQAAGARVPSVRAVAPAGGGAVLIAADLVDGRTLDEVGVHELTDAVLTDAWQQVAAMRRARVAHRDLHLGSLVLDGDRQVWVTNLDFGEPAAGDDVMAGDVAELLVATSVRVGPERAASVAAAVLPPAVLADGVVRIVPAALTRPTRAALRSSDGGLSPLVSQVCRQAGIEEPQPVRVSRFQARYVVTGVMLAAAIYVLAPQAANVPGMIEAVRGAETAWLPLVALMSVATYLGSALAVVGGTPGRVPLGQSGLVALAASFVATVTPPGIGDVALNVRYLQQRGLPGPVAVTASAAKEAAVVTVHVVLLAVCAVWVGRTGVLSEQLSRLPPLSLVAAVVGTTLAVAGVTLTIRQVRRAITRTVLPAVRDSIGAMGQVARNPAKLLMLFSGAAMLPLGYAACLFCSVAAFDPSIDFATVALVSLTAGTLASAAPTPGGVGAVEAVLLAALTGIGIASPIALAAVFLYRIATFWAPIAPGFLSFRWLSARQVI